MPPTPFPYDLIQLQRAWNRTYEALAAPRPRNVTVLRRRLHHLSVRLLRHPYFASVPGGAPAARAELRRRARAYEQREKSAS
ncbi:hypothetical protein OIB37_19230 [Streptomyces sp. NBC_00820]|uniref:hypothetical protein n=1 Tax=Streptomyces sp. NBC_00820 TaxID=2975842 RepID=UPI002ED66B13|nr:hypothetical protein OIB37_19230 [Streptomyces sp. NBC_00820]